MSNHTCQDGSGPCAGCVEDEFRDHCEANADGLIADQIEAIDEICASLGLDCDELKDYLWEKVYQKLMEDD